MHRGPVDVDDRARRAVALRRVQIALLGLVVALVAVRISTDDLGSDTESALFGLTASAGLLIGALERYRAGLAKRPR
ncbi:hypothetical protein [Streptomyces albipurpureus]|uniref:Uncharacterized protein n=1 Tax=Streptomyces albipurpureus TaxID=2897419 RepID=A0ABT0UUL6_9ACTN|nr:hypothetical protein [Streptomyces sp. CWNU-1]MCM2392160.1 hypothetical protein [Streptomyces sp. CWNU-1]